MDWYEVLAQVFELIIYPLLGVLGVFLTNLLSTKIEEIKQKTQNDMTDKYLDILNDIVADAVIATTQTYVDALKKEGKFDAEAQKEALRLTYDAVVGVLTEDALEYLSVVVNDLEAFIISKIEAAVKRNKSI